jgi:hypothetical protein
MNNYQIQISKIDLEYDEPNDNLYSIVITDKITNNKLASFELDIIEICGNCNDFRNFMKLKIEDKYNIFNNFIDDLIQAKTKTSLNFIMENGEKTIRVNYNIITFIISSMSMSCEFNLIITEQLINEFKKIKF